MYIFLYQTLRLTLVTNWIFKNPEADPCYNVYILILTTLKLMLVTMYIFFYQTLKLTLVTSWIFKKPWSWRLLQCIYSFIKPWGWRLLQIEYLKNPGADAYTKYILTTLKLTLSYLLTLLLGYLLTWETKLSCNGHSLDQSD